MLKDEKQALRVLQGACLLSHVRHPGVLQELVLPRGRKGGVLTPCHDM